jgi:hypothetical protein
VTVERVVLVEGGSDRAALLALAARRGRDLAAEGVAVLAMGGVTNVGRFLAAVDPGAVVAGLCDAGEEPHVRRQLERAGRGAARGRADLERLGFFVCDADLEDELIRALGTAAVERVVAELGELGSLRTFQGQPAQRGRPEPAQLRRFMGTRAGRKLRYATALVDALDLDRVPRPLDAVLELVGPGHAGRGGAGGAAPSG